MKVSLRNYWNSYGISSKKLFWRLLISWQYWHIYNYWIFFNWLQLTFLKELFETFNLKQCGGRTSYAYLKYVWNVSGETIYVSERFMNRCWNIFESQQTCLWTVSEKRFMWNVPEVGHLGFPQPIWNVTGTFNETFQIKKLCFWNVFETEKCLVGVLMKFVEICINKSRLV